MATSIKEAMAEILAGQDLSDDAVPEVASILKDTLALIWQDFSKEYEWVWPHDLDSRFSTFVTIKMD